MDAWAGIALALRSPDEDKLYSRLATYLHPLAGRGLAWHALSAIADLRPAPAGIILVSPDELDRSIIGELPAELASTGIADWWGTVRSRLRPEVERLLVVDAAAPALFTSLARLVRGPTGRALIGADNEPLAIWITRETAAEHAGGTTSIAELAGALEPVAVAGPEALLVRDRATLARAVSAVRDRLVDNLLEAGVTFLLPETVLVDLDVRIGPDTVIYPGVILEGQTTIGSETVVGPGCRIIDSWIGSGVELKGWNYIVGANVRNRAVMEPYVRRGFD